MTDRIETAFAKINLALHVRRREEDGYHAIETLFAFAEDGDVLQLTDASGLTIIGPFAEGLDAGEDNLVLRAARGFSEIIGQPVIEGFMLDKRLPVAAGIGGGSADAAAALRLIARANRLAADDPRLFEAAVATGADVAVCLES